MSETPKSQGLSAYLMPGTYDDGDEGYILYLVDANDQMIETAFIFDEPYDQPADAFIEEQIHHQWPDVTIDYARSWVMTR